jgi:hypothetical protein
MSDKHRGACLCGTVRFEVDGGFDSFFLCHCRYCRKDTGSAHGANLFAATAQLTWLSGEDAVRTFRLPGTRHMKGFCALCGSALPYRHPDGGFVVVPAGSLDSEVALRPNAHIFTASRANWDHELAALPGFDRLPT